RDASATRIFGGARRRRLQTFSPAVDVVPRATLPPPQTQSLVSGVASPRRLNIGAVPSTYRDRRASQPLRRRARLGAPDFGRILPDGAVARELARGGDVVDDLARPFIRMAAQRR